MASEAVTTSSKISPFKLSCYGSLVHSANVHKSKPFIRHAHTRASISLPSSAPILRNPHSDPPPSPRHLPRATTTPPVQHKVYCPALLSHTSTARTRASTIDKHD